MDQIEKQLAEDALDRSIDLEFIPSNDTYSPEN